MSEHFHHPDNHGIIYKSWLCPNCDMRHSERVGPVTPNMEQIPLVVAQDQWEEHIYHHSDYRYFGICTTPDVMWSEIFILKYDEAGGFWQAHSHVIDVKEHTMLYRAISNMAYDEVERLLDKSSTPLPNTIVYGDKRNATIMQSCAALAEKEITAHFGQPMPGLIKGHGMSERIAASYNYVIPDPEPQPETPAPAVTGTANDVRPMTKEEFNKLFGEW